jgi:ABC-type transport system involved in multi-copper enzyme maturation permease subunit
MRPVWIIANNTFKEVIRDRILYGLFIFAIFIILFSLALGQLSFAEQARISANFGLSAIQLGLASLAIFVGSTLVTKELEKQTVLTLLVRPLSRLQFILGKFFGLALVIATVMIGLSLILGGVFYLIGAPINLAFGVVLTGFFLESLCLLAFTIFFSMFARPVLVVCFSVSVFFIGHWFSTLRYFSERAPDSSIGHLYSILRFLIPDLESLNWKPVVIYNDALDWSHYALASGYIVLWLLMLMSTTVLLFQRKDLV